MHSNKREGAIEVVLYERSELPPPSQDRADSLHERLVELGERGLVDTVSRNEWRKRMPVADCDRDIRDTYLAFRSWADIEGVRLTPFFQTRECFTPAEGEHTDWLVMPAFCLAVYDGTGVAAVYPHTDEEAKTVEDGLQALLDEGSADTIVDPLVAD
ncbi:HTH domain-containing protein [Salinibaculum rarum]|jgi:hypothetical protein|uniref:HTH domain-containing protein n=1 Tax=Salinibaculum rarum TaxID=3058903 RepID=UPI00265DC99B|nr:HTH domain-containing protein [Salinibaculum sp. KK48]